MRTHQLRWLIRILFLSLFILSLNNLVFASRAGSLDKSFGTGGVAFASVPNTGAQGSRDMIVQPDGKIIVVGTQINQVGNGLVCLARFNLNGTLDTGFGSGGIVITDVFHRIDYGNSITLQPDGKILVGGQTQREISGQKGYVTDPLVIRYNPNGSLDTSFGGGGVSHPNPSNFDWFTNTIVVQPDGKIVLGGNTGFPHFFLTRVNADGSLDTSFGNGGFTYGVAISGYSIAGIELQPDGKIVLAATSSGAAGATVTRWNPNGTLDNTFDNDGVFSQPLGSSVQTGGTSLQSDGKILVIGSASISGQGQMFVLRLNPNGSLDTSFDGDGIALPLAASGGGSGRDVLALGDGRIMAIGGTSAFLIARLRSDGSPDKSFDGDGFATANIIGGNRLLFAPDGKLVTGGYDYVNGTFYPLTASRFLMRRNVVSDFDGDGKTDISVFRPSNGNWYVQNSLNGNISIANFGVDGDRVAPDDYDGDGNTDIAVWRPSTGVWFWINSSNGTVSGNQFGTSGDKPVPGDYDGDIKADIAVFRPSTGTWWIYRSSDNAISTTHFGVSEDRPTLGDFDGDGRSDLALFRPSNGVWYRINSENGAFIAVGFGLGTDNTIPADFDGDSKTDIAIFRPSTGAWYWMSSISGAVNASNFGVSEDKASPADYDGDGRADRTVFRPSQGAWYLMRTSQGLAGQTFGASGDVPTPNAFVK